MEQKFIDRDGLKVLWNQISLKDYPNNETLMAVIDAIDETKANKDELFSKSWNDLTDRPDWIKEETKPNYTVDEIEGAVDKEYVDSKETIVQPFPVIRIDELVPGHVKSAIINVLDLKRGNCYCLSQDDLNKMSDVANPIVQLSVVCDDGTIKNLIENNPYSCFVTPMGIMSSGDFMFYTDRSFNTTYSVDMSDLTTANNIKYTVFNNGRYLGINNTEEFTPTSNYQPATKKYVDDSFSFISNEVSNTYETKDDASAKLEEAKGYADQIKSDILGGAPKETLDTITELATAFEENVEVVEVLNQAITNKADKEHTHNWEELNNKPFGEEEVEITWDGDESTIETVVMHGKDEYTKSDYYHVSDIVPSNDELMQASIVNIFKNSINNDTRNEEMIVEANNSDFKDDYASLCDLNVYIIRKDNISISGMVFPKAGIYFYRMNVKDLPIVDQTNYISLLKLSANVKTLDEKFIPDTIARTSDLLSSGVATFPVHTYQRVSDKVSMYKVNLADLKKGILYSGRGLLESSGTDITFINLMIVCEDGTEKNIVADDGDDLWSIFKNTKYWLLRCNTGNESYRIDIADLSTAANVTRTFYDNQKYLGVYNEYEYTPTNDYHPATKKYVDDTATTAANAIKNDLLNGAGEAYDTLKELGELIDDNVDAIEALEIIATGKANISDIPTKVSELTNDSGFITEAPQADWNQTDETATNYIKNKPSLATNEEIKALFN